MQFFESQWLILLWGLPFLILLFLYASRKKRKILTEFGQWGSISRLVRFHAPGKFRLKCVLLLLGFLLVVLTLGQPQWGEEKKQLKRKGIDLIFMVDTSLSMLAQDVKPSRIDKAKFLMKSFLKHLSGDRVGIVTFAGASYLQSPLTLDYSAFSLFADSIQVGYIPETGTDLSQGIQMAIQSFPKDDKKYRAVIVLSDGEALEGQTENAIQAAKKEKTRFYSIGLGSPEGEPIPLRSSDGKISGYKKDPTGQMVVTKLNVELLESLAKETGGLYFQSTPSEAEVDLIYAHLQSLGKKELKERIAVEREDHYQTFLLIALLILLVETLIGDRSRRETPYETVS